MSNDMERVISDAARVVVLIETKDGERMFMDYSNLLGPVRVSQEFEEIKAFVDPLTIRAVRNVQTGPVTLEIPHYGYWNIHPTEQWINPQFKPFNPVKQEG